MTREQAIQQLKSLRAHCDSMFDDKWSEYEVWSRDILAIDIAIATIAVIEDILGDEYDLDRLRELVQADREGRVHILPSPRENTCGKCGNFTRTPGCGYGECTLRPGLRPYQSRAKCKRYTEKALEEMEKNENG